MPRKEFRNQLYSEVEIHKKLGLNENSIDSFWEALMEETYDPCLTSVSPRKNKKVKKIKGEKNEKDQDSNKFRKRIRISRGN